MCSATPTHVYLRRKIAPLPTATKKAMTTDDVIEGERCKEASAMGNSPSADTISHENPNVQ
ncbi:hypothetical protein NTCA1_55410 [Novosphingobium sp. TCA1]|jgi:hypothetical protein|nr:hypothetical protein NTCA1_55410 [Novosphingobium sp. TCA1]